MAAFERLEKCCEDAKNLPEPEEHEISPAIKTLQFYFPRIFTSDAPRERTVMSETLGKLIPEIFEPKEEDD
ncbi:hypothetical protein SAMD00019534_064550 [Acytostelium subglobosum LB1]|uniref:hypothetical protein n=1 Tax=Acytostelium subglobosum LB1 TaxID=1410327 RepID=UPI0006447B10|nr:hypothetical protein SAMD00019534_064550 [Acytostelium subglobosum LB1]GAM23280.1 hypothetical protein SAMD00019534_064550 [Acytostelium subglobosum LB1]|eukprot:XP_012753729.1 hypothetical protein SAMD00019534_064550 [Acytostelium subglobosum LB1]